MTKVLAMKARMIFPIFLLLILMAGATRAATLTVTNTDNAGAGSLRQANSAKKEKKSWRIY